MRLLGVGDNVVDRYRDLGQMFPGGNALNVAVAARRGGASAAYLGAIGTDRAGQTVLDALRTEAIDLERTRIIDGPNAWADVNVVDGDRVFAGADIGISRFVLDEGDLTYASTFDLIHTGDNSMVESQVADLAGRAPVAFDFSLHRESSYLDPLLPHVTVACFSASEDDEPAVLELLAQTIARGPRWALATRGMAPAILSDGRQIWRQPVIPARIVDTLGAGDSFIGRFLAGLFDGEAPAAALEEAARAAAVTCGSYGAFGDGVPIVSAAALDQVAPAAS
jgi:fructoselysine 6-kinase